MADLTLSEAATRFLENVKGSARQAAMAELNRFTRWYGGDKSVTVMRGHDVATYGESMGPATPETMKRAEQIRAFLVFLNKEGVHGQNLASHLRLKKSTRGAAATARSAQPDTVELTAEGIEDLEKELSNLMEQRLSVREDIRKAMLDKDFRENSPLDAAKDRQGHIEAQIRDIESTLKRAVLADGAAGTGRVRVGCSVTVKNVVNGRTMQYNIVGPTEANAAAGKISSDSPVGKALLNRTPGDEVEISVPAGTMKLVVESVEG